MDDDPTPEGLARCLQVLAEEAACLSMSRTFVALQEAIATCRAESESIFAAGRISVSASVLH